MRTENVTSMVKEVLLSVKKMKTLFLNFINILWIDFIKEYSADSVPQLKKKLLVQLN